MAHELTSGQVATQLRSAGISLSPASIQRYARDGRIPSRSTPGGRYRYNLAEVHAALRTRTATQTLSTPILTGGLGSAELPADSTAERMRHAARSHASTADSASAEGAPSAIHEQLVRAARLSLAFA